ncbi:uncharacterized protein LOC123399553 [Hordeum vulgare subsp. vulgare]|uniref:F-box domain-containing protein n=1 Tax=Hordeum vulgare subsp. vulgare TaxID=112509 RepID=M0W8F4_HORVV|nr:uncharacterized protein LOC123399553 [Hordeum vulgare subsp. vulgare]
MPPPTTPATRPAPTLPDELIEEVLLRLPPDEPSSLVRASLASNFWLGVLTGPTFSGRYRERHGAPPMLGFFYSWPHEDRHEEGDEEPVQRFVFTTKFGARIPEVEEWQDYEALDCRHGRVLFGNPFGCPAPLFVWDPMTGCPRYLEEPDGCSNEGATVLCAVSGCDHRACHGGPVRVVFFTLGEGDGCVAHASVALLEMDDECSQSSCLDLQLEWTVSSGLQLEAKHAFIPPTMAPVLIKDALYFMLSLVDGVRDMAILKFDMGSDALSLIDLPDVRSNGLPLIEHSFIPLAMGDDDLGFAQVDGLTLNLWSSSTQTGADGLGSWTQHRVVDLNNLLPIQNPKESLRLIGSVEGNDIIFVTTDLGIYQISLKSLRWKKLWKSEKFGALIPYMSFYNPQERINPYDAAH